MAYASITDLVPLRLTEQDLAELTGDSDTPNTVVVQAVLDEASATVDAYCGQRYQTPLAPSGLVKQITVDLAIFSLASRRRDTAPTETWTQRRDYAMTFLRDVASGKASLDQQAGVTQAQTGSGSVMVPTQRQTFNDDNLRGFC